MIDQPVDIHVVPRIAGPGRYMLKLFGDTDESCEGVAVLKVERQRVLREFAP